MRRPHTRPFVLETTMEGLKSLHVFLAHSASIPQDVELLAKVESLFLDNAFEDADLHQVLSFSGALDHLKHLRELRVLDWPMESLLPDICQFAELERLSLCGCQLATLPPAIGGLTKLQELNLYRNQLSSLPPEIALMARLEHLNLSRNDLHIFPSTICELRALRVLQVSENALRSLPASIRELRRLKFLFAADNALESLPREICQLYDLEELHVTGNRLPDFVMKRSKASDLLSLLRDLDEDSPVFDRKYCSVFISYGGPDTPFATALYERLLERGVEVFFFPVSSVPGVRLHRTMFEGVNETDRVLLLCSQSSLERPGVLNEIEQVLVREAAEGGGEVLVPIALDDYVFGEWKPARKDLAAQVLSRVVADFRAMDGDSNEFGRQLRRLLAALEKPGRGEADTRGQRRTPKG